MNDTATLAAKVRKLIESHRTANLSGVITETSVDAGNESYAIGEKLTKVLFPQPCTFDGLLDKAEDHGYVPTCRGPLASILGDIYDYAQECRGSTARAYRGEAPLSPVADSIAKGILVPPKRTPKVWDVVTFQRGMYGEWKGRVSNVYVGRAGRFGLGNKGKVMLDIHYSKKNGGYGTYRGVLASNVTLVDGAKYDL